MPAPEMARPDSIAPPMDSDRRDVPIPQTPGGVGGPRPYDPVTAAQYDYVMQGTRDKEGNIGNKVRRSGKDIALATLGGLMRGGVLGAGVGGIGAAISPELGREFNFETFQEPRMQRQMQRAQQRDAIQRQEAIDDLNRRRIETGISADEARIATERSRAGLPMEVSPGASMIDPRTGQILATAPNRPAGSPSAASPRRYAIGGNLVDEAGNVLFTAPPKPERDRPIAERLREAESEFEATEGSPEQIADDSYQGRGGDTYVLSKLPEATRQILEKGTVRATEEVRDPETGRPVIDPNTGAIQRITQERPATPAEVSAAQSAFDRAKNAEQKSILDYTKGERRRKASGGGQRRSTQRGRKGAVGMATVNAFAQSRGVSPEQAKQMFEADGYTVK